MEIDPPPPRLRRDKLARFELWFAATNGLKRDKTWISRNFERRWRGSRERGELYEEGDKIGKDVGADLALAQYVDK